MRFLYVILCFLYNTAYSQHLEWVNPIRGDSLGVNNNGSQPVNLSIDKDNYTYFLGRVNNTNLGTTSNTQNTIIKYREDGTPCWHKNFDYKISTLNANDDFGNVYATAILEKNTQIGTDFYTVFSGRYSCVLIKADSAFNIIWSRLVVDTANNLDVRNIIITDKEILLNGFSNGHFYFKNKKYSNKFTNHSAFTISLNKNGNSSNNEWCSVSYKRYAQLNGKPEVANGYIYQAVSLDTFFFFNDSNLSKSIKWGEVILKTALSDGTLKGILAIPDLNFLQAIKVLSSGKIIVTGTYNQKFNYRSISLTSARTTNHISLLLDNNGDPVWYLKDNDTNTGRLSIQYLTFSNKNIYLFGSLGHGNSSLGGAFLEKKSPQGYFDVVVIKLDTLGNILWFFSCATGTKAMQSILGASEVDNNGNPVFANYFTGNTSILDTVIYSTPYRNSVVFKLSDYSITRGIVHTGPYCAGDTIDIPYILKGKYDTANTFIAQLSDEDGNFFGSERELGRLKAYKDSVIKGVLPLFSVISSGKYRIRILSTIPGAQSYYRQDTLRLLIYSRDTANAGPDNTICLGQKIQLKTTGGSKWEWTPTATLDNPATYKPVASPTTDTEYRIIISDSSGCGDIDTDYVKVYVKPPLKLSVNSDTTICYKGTAVLKAVAQDGKPAYKLRWLDNTGAIVDSSYTTPVSPLTTAIYTAVLTDNCPQSDTQKVRVTVKPPLSLKINNNDSICMNEQVLLNAVISGGDSASRLFQWSEINSTWTSLAHVFPVFPKINTTYYARLSDNCSPSVNDSLVITVLPVPIADFEVNFTNGCPPVTVNFTDNSTGNDTLLNIWKILPAEAPGVKTHAHPFYNSGNYNFGLIVRNRFGCVDDTSRSVRIDVYTKPTASFFIKPEIKEVEGPLFLYNTSQNGNTYTWDFGNGTTLEQNNRNDTTFTYTDSGTYTINLIAENDKGCRDTTRQTIRVFDKVWCTIPNAFTPNGDGMNPVFAPVCVGVANYTLTIYSRWGQVLRNCENCAWDGTYDGIPVIDGVYMYKIQLQGDNRRKSTAFGTVNVIR